MANEVIYKHPDSTIIEFTDFTPDLPDDTTLEAVAAGATEYKLYDSSGADITGNVVPADILTVALVISASNLTLQITIAAGTEGEDYIIECIGKGAQTSAFGVRLVEVRVGQGRGVGDA